MTSIPQHGEDKETLLEHMESLRKDDAKWREGRTWSLVYYAGDAHHDFLKKAHNIFFAENGLNPLAFKSLKTMEGEVVRMSANMLNGGPDTVGTMSSGGTESILLAVKAARDRARKQKPWIIRPEIVAPATIHVAFDKAAHYFGVRMRYIPIGEDLRADVKAMKRAIGRNTILVAASAPQYPHGVVDPIEELGQIAQDRSIPFHVDACIGGFILPWVEKLGYELPVFDFRVPGVTSISADIHKYGYGSKGASVILYRDMSYLKHQFFVSTDWPGGIYASPSMPGTRPGGPIAAAWAALKAMGEDGYMKLAEEAMQVSVELQKGIRKIDGLRILGTPHATIVAFTSTEDAELDIYAVADQLEERGWNVDRQQSPPSIHCTTTSNHSEILEEYLKDLQASVDYVRAHPETSTEGNAPMYGMMAKVPFRGLIKHSILKVMEGMYGAQGEVPDLSKIGEGEDDGLLLKLIGKYGDQAMDLMAKIDKGRESIKESLRLGR